MSNAGETSSIGLRIESEGYFGTILYEGEIPPTKGKWLGIDWDDPSRGKHDGSHKGMVYFKASHQTSGSFLRPQKANYGVSFCEALHDRYGRIDDVDAGVIQEDMFVIGENQQRTVVQVVGAQKVNLKQSKFEDLEEVRLRDIGVRDPGVDGEIAAQIPNVSDLDISYSLFTSFDPIAKITSQLPNLKILNVSDNRLKLPIHTEELENSFSTVRVLYMNRMRYNWDEISSCLELFTNVKDLHICFNQISAITSLIPNLHSITTFNIESNPVESWESLLPLGNLPNLETLILNRTGLTTIAFPRKEGASKTELFPNLISLSITHNQFNSWEIMNELNTLPKLAQLNFKFNPLTESISLESVRSIVVAKISDLKYLNRTEVTGEDRKGAEIDYLKGHGKKWRESGGDQDPSKNNPSEEFQDLHPNYQKLVDKYGPPEDSEFKVQSSALKNNLVAVTIDCQQKPGKKPIKKKLPVTMHVQKLKSMLQRLFKVDAYDMILTYTSHKHIDGPEIQIDNDMKELGYYSIEDEDTIHISFK